MPSGALTRTEQAVLGILAWGGESSGYDLRRRADRSLAFIWTPVRSHLYTVLPRLVTDGLLDVRHVDQRGKPDKQIYAINDAGRRALAQWIDTVDPIEPDDRDGLLLKVFFAAYGSPGSLERQLTDFRERTLARLDAYRQIEREITASGEAERDPHPFLALRMGIALAETNLTWLDETLQRPAPCDTASRADLSP